LTVQGDVPDDQGVIFFAGAFPRTVSINRERVDPLTDARFELTAV
jgi:hypothetical protein